MESLLTRWLTNLSSCNISFNSTIWLHIQISWIHCSPEWWTHLLIVLQASKLSYGYIYKSNGFISDKNKPRYISLNSSFTILIRNESVRFVYVTPYGNIEAWITITRCVHHSCEQWIQEICICSHMVELKLNYNWQMCKLFQWAMQPRNVYM